MEPTPAGRLRLAVWWLALLLFATLVLLVPLLPVLIVAALPGFAQDLADIAGRGPGG